MSPPRPEPSDPVVGQFDPMRAPVRHKAWRVTLRLWQGTKGALAPTHFSHAWVSHSAACDLGAVSALAQPKPC